MDEPLQPRLGARIRDLRMRKGLSQTELAEAIGVTNVWLCNVERGHELPSLVLLIRLADVLDVSVAYLFR